MPIIPLLSGNTYLTGSRTTKTEEELAAAGIPLPTWQEPADIENPTNPLFVAGQVHSIGNREDSGFSFTDTVASIPKFIAVSLLSGANQLYNIAPTLGNMLGGDFELSDASNVIAQIDDNLSAYYQEHQQGADVLGFLISSFVPGAAGLKVLNASQKILSTAAASGKYGNLISKATGLLVPKKAVYINDAIKAVTTRSTPFQLSEKNMLKAFASGVHSSVLEAAAVEGMIQVTMQDSPVLEGQDIGDIFTNIATGAVVFGAIGGVLEGAKTVYSVKKAVKAADKADAPWNEIKIAPKGFTPDQSLIYYMDEIKKMPPVPTGERADYIAGLAKKKVDTYLVKMREEFGKLSPGDQAVAQDLWELSRLSDVDSFIGSYQGVKSVSKVSTITSAEKRLQQLKAKPIKTKTLMDMEEEVNTKITYSKINGSNMGKTQGEKPIPLKLADTLAAGETLTVTGNTVKAGKFSRTFNIKDQWDTTLNSVMYNNARQVWLDAVKPAVPSTIYEQDLQLLKYAYKNFDKEITVSLKGPGNKTVKFTAAKDLLDFIEEKVGTMANSMLKNSSDNIAAAAKIERIAGINADKRFITQTEKMTQEEIAAALDVTPEYLSNTRSQIRENDLFANDFFSGQYTKMMRDAGILDPGKPAIDLNYHPSWVKVVTDTAPVKDLDGNILKGIAITKQQSREYQSNLDRAVASVIGEDELIFYAEEDLLTANRLGAGRGFLGFANENYGTIASKAQYNGSIVHKMKVAATERTDAVFQPVLAKLLTDQEAAIEVATITAKVRSIPEKYVLSPEGDALIPARLAEYLKKKAAGKKAKVPQFEEGVEQRIPIKNDNAKAVIAAHVAENNGYRSKLQTLRAAQGDTRPFIENEFYPIPVNTKDFKHVAIVEDTSIAGIGSKKTIYAASSKELQEMIDKVPKVEHIKVHLKQDIEDWYKAVGRFDYEKTLYETNFNAGLARRGISSPYYVPTDPKKIAEEFLSWHKDRAVGTVMEAVSTKFELPFAQLEAMGKRYTSIDTSKYGSASLYKYADEIVKNPYMDIIKTTLDIRNTTDYPFWVQANRLIDSKFTQMFSAAKNAIISNPTDEGLMQANKFLREAGYTGPSYDMEMQLLANHTAPRGALTAYVQKSNSILATTTLRLDQLNAVNNWVGSNVLLGTETKAVLRAIESGDAEAVGKLAKLAYVKVPGTDKPMLSATKLIAKAIKDFRRDSPQMQWFKDHNFVTSISDQYNWTLDQLTLTGKESVRDLSSKPRVVQDKLVSLANKGEEWTGNKLAEEFNRFVSAHVMKQLTDIAVEAGKMNAREALAYINTFVNRTQGNYLASQRPVLFQGPLGQAIGLFQTYQFTLMQQLLRHMGEGKAKDVATLLGLQGTIYGMNGLPGFNAINTHIVGTLSGNKEHTDAYDVIYGGVNKDAADWLMYGVASNMFIDPDLKINLYTRGDINPRHVTIVPTAPADLPIYGAYAKFFSNIVDTASNVFGGADISQSLLRGIEHNGISRPLAGLGQILQGIDNEYGYSYATTKTGNLIGANDLISLTNMARFVGGKPLAEAITTDAAFRYRAYQAVDRDRIMKIGEALRSKMIAGEVPTQEDINYFAEKYVAAGGSQKQFSQYMLSLYKGANTAQANALAESLKDRYAQKMQLLMGGNELEDFITSPNNM